MVKSCEFCIHKPVCILLKNLEELLSKDEYSDKQYDNGEEFLAHDCEHYNIKDTLYMIDKLGK